MWVPMCLDTNHRQYSHGIEITISIYQLTKIGVFIQCFRRSWSFQGCDDFFIIRLYFYREVAFVSPVFYLLCHAEKSEMNRFSPKVAHPNAAYS